MFKATYTYICVANFCVHTVFFLLPIFVSTFSFCTDCRIVYIYVYIHILLRVEQTDPDIWSYCPLSPPTLRPFFSLCYPCRVTEPLMVVLHACNRYIRINVDRHVHHFVCLAQIKLRDDDVPLTSVLWSRFSTRIIHVKQLMCCRSRSNEFLPFYHVFPLCTSVLYDAVWWRIDNFLNLSLHN